MKKTFTFLSLFALIITSLCIYYVKVNENEKHLGTTIQKAFENSGAKLVNCEVYVWAPVKEAYGNLEKVYPIAENIMSSIGVKKDNQFIEKTMENDLVKKIDINALTYDEKQVNIQIQVSKDISKPEERFISVSVIQDKEYNNIGEISRGISKVFEDHGISPKVNSCITGSFEGILKYNQLNKIAANVLKQTEAKKVEGMRDGNFISVSAYTPYMERYIRVNGKKVNLNFACRYNSYEDKTYIWLATPVITIEY